MLARVGAREPLLQAAGPLRALGLHASALQVTAETWLCTCLLSKEVLRPQELLDVVSSWTSHVSYTRLLPHAVLLNVFPLKEQPEMLAPNAHASQTISTLRLTACL